MTKLSVTRLGLAAALLSLPLVSVPARAEEGVLMKDLLGTMGIIPKERETIRYRERAPLVLPPKMDLRPPAPPESYASSNPQWPRDPDVVARQRRSAESRVPVTDSETRRMSERSARLSVDEMRAGRDPDADTAPIPGTHRGDSPRDVLMNNTAPERSESTKTAAATDTRRTLTDPPTGFRKPTGAPARLDNRNRGDEQRFDANPLNWVLGKKYDDDE
ncbi:MAG: hypothetical protein JO048_03895 [Methylobacteriaceae bacterium]|nr:hypothetical protein [Methylobacteriaceae bacterium]